MPKQVPEAVFEAVVNAVARLPDGGSVSRIDEALGASVPRRTLQRRLAALVSQGRLVREGRGQGILYRLPSPQSARPVRGVQSEDPIHLRFEAHLNIHDRVRVRHLIPVSEEGKAVGRLVRAPIQQRPPVGYERAFLEGYEPGSTWYLPEELRHRLLELGGSPDYEDVAGTQARKIHQRLLIDLSWNSSRLEGNTYSLLETARLLELGEPATGKDASETQMILNHKAAIDLLLDKAEQVGFNRYTILNLHALLAENLLPDPGAGGRLRTAGVQIGGSSYHPLEVPQLIDECFGQVLHKAAAIPDPFEQAFFALVHFPYLQPFLDVNKRVSRLAANLPLIRNNLCPLSFVDVPTQAYVDGLLGIYEYNRMELLRDVFRWAYERSCARYSAVRQSLGEPDPFRQRHRALIAQTIREAVQARMNKSVAAAHIRQRAAEGLQETERERFIEIVETDLLDLHEGNIARAQVSPREFKAWQAEWQ